ncbi:hypothetical protein B7Z28_01345, partial [Candidatus Saccharibacteria bacterium 32-45-3]
MKITDLTAQVKNQSRINVIIDGVYRFSLDLFQATELGVRVGREYTEAEIEALEQESQFGKLYARALDYAMLRPHSAKEMRDYLWKKTQPKSVKKVTHTGVSWSKTEGVSKEIADRVYDRLVEKGYIDDVKFCRFWVSSRNLRKGMSQRKLRAELGSKGVSTEIIEQELSTSERSDMTEIEKMIQKNQKRYDDQTKLIGF